MEFYTKFRIKPGHTHAFLTAVEVLVDAALSSELTRFDWFVHEGEREAVCLTSAATDAAHEAFVGAAAPLLAALQEHATSETHLLGTLPSANAPGGLHGYSFDDGLRQTAPMQGLQRRGAVDGDRIEIVTWFKIHPGDTEAFCTIARDMTAIVRRLDPGTSRYDWFYDAAGQTAIAMDTYDDTAAMRAHMHNCHDPHAALLQHAHMKMKTEFLGELSAGAAEAISRYSPYVLPFKRGLHRG